MILYLLRFNLKRLPWFRPANDYLQKFENESPHSPRPESATVSEHSALINEPNSLQETNSSFDVDISQSTSIIEAAVAPEATLKKKKKRKKKHKKPGYELRKKSVAVLRSLIFDHEYHELDQSVFGKGTYLHSKFEHSTFRLISVLCFSTILIIVFLSLAVIQYSFMGNSSATIFLSMLFSVCFVVFKRYERNTANSFFAFFLLFILLIGTVFIIGNIQMTRTALKQHAIVHYKNNRTSNGPYDICSYKWENFTIIDYALFSYLAYEVEPYFSMDLKSWFPECSDCKMIYQGNSTVVFSDLFIPSKNLSIVTVRGTESLFDVVQDFDMWKEVGLLQVASYLGPFINVWPDELTAYVLQIIVFEHITLNQRTPKRSNIIFYVSSLEKIAMDEDFQQQRYYYQNLNNYVGNITDRKVVLVGHSLGM